ncbi:MAG TPA: TraB/GumN family protein [Rhizomicrobium sp.]|jgi:hypothetical protein|nr:TraB/GumN family protein [Rhizomicrobium sp.]
MHPALRSVFLALVGAVLLLGTSAPAAEPAPPPPVVARIMARPALWVVHSHAGSAYLFGSVHLLPPNIDWRSREVEKALAASDVFVFEAPLGDSGKEKTTAFVRANGMLPPEVTLPSLFDDKTRRDYQAALQLTHVSPDLIVHLRPWLAALVLETHVATAMHYSPDSGVDRQVWAYATQQKKPTEALETVDEQLSLFMPKDRKLEVEEFDASLKELGADTNQVGALVDAWTDGRVNEVGRLMNAGLKSTPGAMKLLIDDRNARWVTRISTMLSQHRTYFITVGAAHLAGPHGLPTLLAARGYRVTQIAPR